MPSPALVRLGRAKLGGWAFIFVFWAVMIPLGFWVPTAWPTEFTYETSTPPGTLVSTRWDWQFWSVGMYVLLWTIPITLAFALSYPMSFSVRTFHIVLLLLLFIWFVVQMVFGIVYYARANGTESDNYDNPANDPRWCCVYFNLPGAPCQNTVACVPGVGIGDLMVDKSFLFRFYYNIVLIVFIIVDFFYVWLVLKRSTEGVLAEKGQGVPLIQSRMRRRV